MVPKDSKRPLINSGRIFGDGGRPIILNPFDWFWSWCGGSFYVSRELPQADVDALILGVGPALGFQTDSRFNIANSIAVLEKTAEFLETSAGPLVNLVKSLEAIQK